MSPYRQRTLLFIGGNSTCTCTVHVQYMYSTVQHGMVGDSMGVDTIGVNATILREECP